MTEKGRWREELRGRREEVSVKVEVERGGCCLSV